MLDLKNIKTIDSSFLKLIDIIPDAIVIVDKEGKIQHVNSHVQKMFGYSENELIGKEVEVLMPVRYRSKHVDHRASYGKSPTTRPMGLGLDLFGRRKDGTEVPLDIMLSRIDTEEGPLVISVIRDITELRKREEEIKKQSRQLEDIVSTMTHDLKTPLLAVQTGFKHFLEGAFGGISEQQKQILNLLVQNNSSTLKLVNNLLSVFKYESKSYRLLLEPVEILNLIDKAVGIVKPLLVEKKINIKTPETNFKFICDPFEVERVILNLLMNSINYSSNGGKIEIRVIKDEEGKVLISVEDNGKGIVGEDMPNLFERFWQSKRANTVSNTAGLGLYLSRQIVEAHGGRIFAESKPGKGTKVTFEIPDIKLS